MDDIDRMRTTVGEFPSRKFAAMHDDPKKRLNKPIVVGSNHGADLAENVALTIGRLNAIGLRYGLPRLRHIGCCVLANLFDDSADAWRRQGKRHAEMRLLHKANGLQIERSDIALGVHVEVQCRELGAIADSLSVAHHEALIPLRDVATKRTLARRVVENKLTVAALQGEIALLSPPRRSKRGRPPKTSLAKALDELIALNDSLPDARTPQDADRDVCDAIDLQVHLLVEWRDTLLACLASRTGPPRSAS